MPGSEPTNAQVWESMREHIDYVQERDRHGNANTPSIYSLYSDALTDTGGRFMGAALRELGRDRRDAGDILSSARLQAIFGPHLTEQLRAYNLPRDGSYEERLFRLIEHIDGTGELFTSRGMTFATPTFAGAVGTGIIRRCTVDRFSNNLECTGAEAKSAEVVRDQANGGKKHRERFRFEGATPATDNLNFLGSGILGEYEAADCIGGILRNPSFEQGAGSTDNATPAATTTISGWTLSAAASFRIRVESEQTSPHALVYRGYDGSPIGTGLLASLEFFASGNITQTPVRAAPGAAFDLDRPYFVSVAWRRRASATGTLTLALGAISAVVDVSTVANDVWQQLILPIGANSWYRQFGGSGDIALTITMGTLAVGQVAIDDVMCKPMSNVDGTYYLPVGGATPWVEDDRATWTDTEAVTRARFSYWLWRSLLRLGTAQGAGFQALRGVWLPTTTTAGAVTIAD